jgi:hypothetical protein
MSIEQLRAKLIDLSLRNKLLTLRLARGSSINVVDELPEQVFEALRDSKSFTLRTPAGSDALLARGILGGGGT